MRISVLKALLIVHTNKNTSFHENHIAISQFGNGADQHLRKRKIAIQTLQIPLVIVNAVRSFQLMFGWEKGHRVIPSPRHSATLLSGRRLAKIDRKMP